MSSQQIQEVQSCEVAGFISKIFEIFHNQQFAKIAFWAPSGQEFIIKDTNKFQQIVLPKYFRHNKMNSFIRQLNMYGFHKNRADHSKSVFSHPSFLKGRPDLLNTIKRKIKNKKQEKLDQALEETPVKKQAKVDTNSPNSKVAVSTGNQLTSIQHFGEGLENTSFNFMGTKENLNPIMNLNCSLNVLPRPNLGQIDLEDLHIEESQIPSIADNMELKEQKEEVKAAPGVSYKFVNPSCFFESMRKGAN